jgi:DNA-binding NarL/FixJ family response regulator
MFLASENASFKVDGLQLSDFVAKYRITRREQEIIELILAGKGNNEIADTLYISLSTVKQHIQNIYNKAEVNSRLALAQSIKKQENSTKVL